LKESNESLAAELEVAAARPQEAGERKRNPVRRLYDWTTHWAQTPYGPWALFALAFAEASFFPVPPDVLLIALALGAPKKSLRYAAICTAGSVLGGCLGYAIGLFLMDAVGYRIIDFYRARDVYAQIAQGFQQYGFVYIFIAALTPIPYKVFTIAAGACRVGLGVLILASVVGRGARFFLVGSLFWLFGVPVKRFIDRYFNLLTILFVALGALGFVLVKIIWKG